MLFSVHYIVRQNLNFAIMEIANPSDPQEFEAMCKIVDEKDDDLDMTFNISEKTKPIIDDINVYFIHQN